MGSEWSSCCSVEPAGDKQVVNSSDKNEHVPKPSSPTKSGRGGQKAKEREYDGPDVEKFQRKLEDVMDVIVLLADGTRLTCQLKLNVEDKFLAISCEKNVRLIQLSDLKAILHGRDQLKRVETKASLIDDPNCVALHMVTGNCIPVRFEVLEDKIAFVELIRRIKG
eukprot:CAMPEP_0113848056 /NCGR_PEP_ID=MMETSP0372-20130328/2237_1 /TAXON_ID=340204 /ORGANISM="Lankesteria abbotti" /LENGTH=165 /DNA_ID=CAMNT_0000817441 /DNA_START=260 /DNA_END=757 /DNA_ORIENTATION=+ /assembly_acc=CAM_ASM_000359